ncbi:WecB/TagA/CpsF family glycosyltransferase, partial [Enterococcus sp. 3C8_DIV0646]|uniref:WecB/TagA/CpsF family glycosyltransferase n=1 Tax=Enterococcus sp. 3C8_DIV0646 TaxID=1834175 RepID=UPI0020CD7AE8
PRIDATLSKNKDSVYGKLKSVGVNIRGDRKKILYCPTWKGQNVHQATDDICLLYTSRCIVAGAIDGYNQLKEEEIVSHINAVSYTHLDVYPDLIVAGAIDGYNQLKEEEIVSHINESNSDMLFVALGFPRQEQWLARNIRELNVSIFQDVGGSFDVISGHVKRAPNIFIKFHLEWLYRSLSNPKRLGRILQLPIFLCKSIV